MESTGGEEYEADDEMGKGVVTQPVHNNINIWR
jgi:hypothetical protein